MFSSRFFFTLIFVISMFGSLAFAQAGNSKTVTSDLSGTWKLDSVDKTISEKLVIVGNDAELVVKGEFSDATGIIGSDALTYYADGRGESNEFILPISRPWRIEKTTVKTKTRWKGGKLVTYGAFGYLPTRVGARPVSYKITEQWELTKNGEVLVRKTLVESGGNMFPTGPDAQPPIVSPQNDLIDGNRPREIVRTYRRSH